MKDPVQHPLKDHREIGRQLGLFMFNDAAPGAVFWLDKGMTIVKELENYLRQLYQKEDILEVSTPILVNKKLWERSGHWEKFKENMFVLKDGNQDFALKPMNCPEAALIYESKIRSYHDLPLRLGEIGRLHRNEVSGSLGGLFRVRQMTMDDLHIFCRPDQIETEIQSTLRQIQEFHQMFGFKIEFFLATKPDKAMGEEKLWHEAEAALKKALENNSIQYTLKPGDGAFYGPKIDINVKDSQERDWTISTIQVDFNIPERFKLEYIDADGKPKRPVIIHRAIFGTFERFIGILLEHIQGNLPIWLAPVQVKLLPVSDQYNDFAGEIAQKLITQNIRVEIDTSNESVSHKVRSAELQKVPYYVVVGAKEKESGQLATTSAPEKKIKSYSTEELIQEIQRQ